MDEYGISQMLGSHLRDVSGAHVVEAVETHRNLMLSEHRVLRSPWRWTPDGTHRGCLAVIIATSGTVRLANAGKSPLSAAQSERQVRAVDRGAAVLCGCDHRATLWFGGQHPSCVILWVPESVCAELGIEVEEPLQLHDSLLLSMLRAIARRSLRTSRLRAASTHEDFVLERVLSSLLVGSVIEISAGVEYGQQLERLEQARTVMLANLTDPDFTVEALADALNISTRQLQRHYAQLGTTPSEALKALRIEIATGLMERQPSLPRKQIAARAGFRSVAALRRALESEATRNG